MSTLLQFGHSATGLSLYGHLRDGVGQVFNYPSDQFQSYSSGQWANYSAALAEQGGSSFYQGNVPSTILAGDYLLAVYRMVGGSPAEGDPLVGILPVHFDGADVVDFLTRAGAAELDDALDRLDDIQDRLPATTNGFADVLLDRADGVEDGFTPRQALRLLLSALAGKVSGANQAEIVFRDVGDQKDRIVAQTDAFGNRTEVTYDVSD